jgi:RNA polymerase sigma-70 factor (ECF subfamily)
MRERDLLADQFEQHRPRLRAVAYRMLGSLSESEDAVQEAWLRLSRTDETAVENLGAWLTTVVGRVALDMLRARRSRREDYIGSWLPEPIVTTDDRTTPEQDVLLADAVGLALLVVLETLSPHERLAFVLHDMFAVPFDEIAEILDSTPAAARQLASRGRRRIQGVTPEIDVDLTEQRAVVEAFLAAARGEDFDALVAVLDPDVVFHVDAGADSSRARPPVTGAREVADALLTRGTRMAPYARHALVNGAAGLVVVPPSGRPVAVLGFTIAGGRIVEVDLIVDPAKLPALP